jgi:Sporulation and spore germination
MSRRAAGWILGIALLLVAGTLVWWWRSGHGGRQARTGRAEGAAAGAIGERRPFDLYFPANGGGLRAERRELQVSEDPKDRIRKVLLALLAGPSGAPSPAAPPPASPAAPGSAIKGSAAKGSAPAAGPAAAPNAAGLVGPLPPEVKLGDVQLSADGTAFVDLRWPDHEDPPESGSTEELQRVYSLVDSVALNVPQVSRVVLLWNGTQRVTFSGHLDTSRPLVPDRSLLAP